MIRLGWLVVALLLLASTGQAFGSGQGQAATTSPSPVTTPLDLAAMALTPADLAAAGLTSFGQRASATLTLTEQAEQAAPGLGRDPETVREALISAGFERRYQLQLGLPQRLEGPSSRLRTFVTSYLLEYAAADGAAAGLALLEAEPAGAATPDVPQTREIGDRSEMTRLREATEDGEPYRALDLTFQRGNLVAGVTLGQFGGREPDQAVVEELGARLLAKIEAGLTGGGPGLSHLAVRLGGAEVETRSDEYGRRDGVTFPNYAETEEELADRVARYGEAIDVYGVVQSIRGGPARTDDVRFQVLLHRFASDEAAAAWLHGSVERARQFPNVIAATPVADAATIGDASLTLAVTTRRSSAGVARGYLIDTRVGPLVARVQMLGVPDVPLRAVAALARSQAACLRVGACPERAGIPTGLPPAATPAPFASAAPGDGADSSDACVANAGSGTPVATPPVAATDGPGDGGAGDGARPNIVLILTDDLDARSVACMPNVRRLLAGAGVTFSNAFVTTPLCCPSRASILRGQYAHNHGVLSNSGEAGGFPAFHARGDEASTVATWLHDAGYRTALFGKYLNRYPRGADPAYVAPGWDEWATFTASDADDEGGSYYYDYTLNTNGALVTYGHEPSDYSTDVLAAMGIDFVERASASGQPFFLYLAPFAPHGPSTPAPRHSGALAGAVAPRVPSFGEGDVTDKPAWVRASAPLSADDVALIDDRHQRRLRSLAAVDEMVASLIATLEATGTLDTTYVVFSSDNGFHLGEHRLPLGKQSAYDEATRVPLIVRGPGVPAGVTVEPFALNIDLAPTFAALAGAAAPAFVDGRSLVPLLTGEEPATWRQGFLVELYGRGASNRPGPPGDAGSAPDREEDGESGISPIDAPSYLALRTHQYLYIAYEDGERELYDLHSDPYQLQNRAASADPALLAALAADLDRLRACAAATCRAAEETLNGTAAARGHPGGVNPYD